MIQLKSLRPHRKHDGSIDRTITVMSCLLRTHGTWIPLDTIAQKTSIASNVLSRSYLANLIDRGWIEEGIGCRYRLTREILSMQVIQGLKAIHKSEGV